MLNNSRLDFVRRVLTCPEHEIIIKGFNTHDAAVTLAQHTAAMIDKDRWCESIQGLLPKGYDKNLPEELPKIYDWGLEHGFSDKHINYEAGTIGPIPKGCTKDEKFAFYDQRLSILKTKTAKQLTTPAELLDLAPKSFWAKIAPAENRYGFDAVSIGDSLITACLDKGKLDPTRIRGLGVWTDKKGQVVNSLEGPIPAENWFSYVRFQGYETLEGKELSPQKVLEWLQLFNWKNPDHAILLLGWLSYAPICGALSQRPHLYLTGAKNTGKTSILIGIESILKPLVLVFDGSVTTEAGLRQKLGENALPVIIDEFEVSNHARRERIMDLARSSYSANASGVKGTPSGQHMEFLISSTFLFSGIDFPRDNAANASRLFVTELAPHSNDLKIEMEIEAGQIAFSEQQTSWCRDRATQAADILKPHRRKTRKLLTEDQVQLIMQEAQRDSKWGVYYAFLFLTGVRPSEMLALLWDDVDLVNGRVLICRNQTANGQLKDTPKTEAGVREIPLNNLLIDMLRDWKSRCPKLHGKLYRVFTLLSTTT